MIHSVQNNLQLCKPLGIAVRGMGSDHTADSSHPARLSITDVEIITFLYISLPSANCEGNQGGLCPAVRRGNLMCRGTNGG